MGELKKPKCPLCGNIMHKEKDGDLEYWACTAEIERGGKKEKCNTGVIQPGIFEIS